MTKADERLERLEASIARIEALGGLSPAQTSVNPDGSPGHVAPGELIESAWGNSVSDTFTAHSVILSNHQDQLTGHYNEFQRRHAWLATDTGTHTFGTTRIDYPNLQVTVPFAAGRIYRASAFVPWIIPTLDGIGQIFITSSGGTVFNTAVMHNEDGFPYSLYVSVVNIGAFPGDGVLKVMAKITAGSMQSLGGADMQAYILVEELSLGTA